MLSVECTLWNVVLASVMLVLCSCAHAGQNATSAARVETIKLEKFGWQLPVPPHPGRLFMRGGRVVGINSEIDGIPSPSVTIDSQGRVLCSFTVRGKYEGLVRRSRPDLLLRIVRFARDGTPDFSVALPTDNWLGNGVYLDDRDQIIAHADGKLQMLVEDGQGRGNWKVLAPCGPHCEVWQSPSRRTLYLYTWDAAPQLPFWICTTPPRFGTANNHATSSRKPLRTISPILITIPVVQTDLFCTAGRFAISRSGRNFRPQGTFKF